MNVRFATKDDLPAIVAIYNEAVGEGYANADIAPVSIESRQQWFEEHDADRYPIYILGEEGVMGWCSLSPYQCGRLALRHTVEISYYVAARHRRRSSLQVDQSCHRRCSEVGFPNVFWNPYGHE